jgi:hypothetical protein
MASFDIDLQISVPLCLRARSVCAVDESLTETRRHGDTETRRHDTRHEDTKTRRHEEDERTGADPGRHDAMKNGIGRIIHGEL